MKASSGHCRNEPFDEEVNVAKTHACRKKTDLKFDKHNMDTAHDALDTGLYPQKNAVWCILSLLNLSGIYQD